MERSGICSSVAAVQQPVRLRPSTIEHCPTRVVEQALTTFGARLDHGSSRVHVVGSAGAAGTARCSRQWPTTSFGFGVRPPVGTLAVRPVFHLSSMLSVTRHYQRLVRAIVVLCCPWLVTDRACDQVVALAKRLCPQPLFAVRVSVHSVTTTPRQTTRRIRVASRLECHPRVDTYLRWASRALSSS